MTAGRWERVKELVAASAELGSDERHEYLASTCGSDADLRAQVESILLAAEQAPDLVERPAMEVLKPEFAPGAEPNMVGKQFGAYRVARRLGTGGMGVVYLGQRADHEFDQQVAIKIIRGAAVDGDVYRRFCQERQTLAGLNHPHIARLLDGGRTPDGLPYLIMEYVDGQPIDIYCDERRLNVAARLALFRSVCSAVTYAHQHLTVHRDIKPCNIHVTGDGTPKLLDFGIAKVLNPEAGDASDAVTRTMQCCLTPEYASPEQLRGRPITTASDVYSLGVLLYELLTGRRPFHAKSGLLHDLVRTACEDEPLRPSTAVSRPFAPAVSGTARPGERTPAEVSETREGPPEKLRRRLAGDLDAIVLMAMRKEPQRRYASVEQLSDDIRRHLEGLPVRARRDTLAYRSLKFTRRHWPGVAAAAIVALSLVGATVMSVRASLETRRERDAALSARRFADQEAANARVEARKSERVTQFLQNMIAAADPGAFGPDITIGRLLDEAAERVTAEFGDDPEAESAVHSAIGDSYKSLGRYDDAERHLRTALDLQRRMHGGDHWDVAKALNGLGVLLHAKGDLPAAQRCLEQALAMHRKAYGDEHPDVARDMNNLAVVLRMTGADAQAEPMLRQALAVRRRLFGDEHLDTAQSLNNLVALLLSRQDYAAAEPLCRDVLAVRRKLLGDEHPDVAQAINNLGVTLAFQGRLAEAEPLLREALALYRKLLGPDHPDLAGNLSNLAALLLKVNDHAGALPLLRECLDIRTTRLPPGDTRTAATRQTLGSCLIMLQRYEEAEPHLLDAYRALDAALGAEHAQTHAAVRTLVSLYENWDRPEAAASCRKLLPRPPPASSPSQPQQQAPPQPPP